MTTFSMSIWNSNLGLYVLDFRLAWNFQEKLNFENLELSFTCDFKTLLIKGKFQLTKLSTTIEHKCQVTSYDHAQCPFEIQILI